MKRIVYTLLLIMFVFINDCDSQFIRSYGGKIGISRAYQDWSYAGMLSDLPIYDKYRTGLDIGVFVEWFDLPVFSVLTEAHYVQKGCYDEFEVTTAEYPEGTGEMKPYTPRIDYLSFPLLAKIRFDVQALTFYGIAGYRVDFLIGKNSDASGVVFDNLKSTDHGFVLGFGIEMPITSEYRLGSEFRYSNSSPAIYTNQHLTVKNGSMEFLLSIGF